MSLSRSMVNRIVVTTVRLTAFDSGTAPTGNASAERNIESST